jgi:hypothetical protein
MSEVSPLARVGGGPGRRAALICPSGAEDGVIIFENDPSLAVRSEGGLGGEIEACDGCNVGGDSDASSGRFPATEGCDAGLSGEVLLCKASSISEIARLFASVQVSSVERINVWAVGWYEEGS